MLFNLLVAEFENLKAFWESSLSCFCVREVVHNFLVRICLLDIVIVEVNDGVSIRECLPPDSIAKDHFLLSIQVCPLDLAIVSNYLVLDRDIGVDCSAMVFLRHLHLEVFVVVLKFFHFTLLALSLFFLLCLLLLWSIFDLRDIIKMRKIFSNTTNNHLVNLALLLFKILKFFESIFPFNLFLLSNWLLAV